MKKIIAVGLCLVLALSLVGCGTKETGNGSSVAGGADIPNSSEVIDTEKTQEATIETDKDTPDNNVPLYAEMSIADGSYKDNKATFILKNNSNEEYNYGSEYAIEEQVNGEWLEIVLDPPLTWNAVIMKLEPQSSIKFEVDFSFGYGALKDGTYRLSKTICDKDRNWSIVYAEFSIPELCGLPLAPEGFTKP